MVLLSSLPLSFFSSSLSMCVLCLFASLLSLLIFLRRFHFSREVKEEKKLVGGTGNISIRAHYNRNRPSERKKKERTGHDRLKDERLHETTFTLTERDLVDEDEKWSRHIRSKRRERHKTGRRLVSSSKWRRWKKKGTTLTEEEKRKLSHTFSRRQDTWGKTLLWEQVRQERDR